MSTKAKPLTTAWWWLWGPWIEPYHDHRGPDRLYRIAIAMGLLALALHI